MLTKLSIADDITGLAVIFTTLRAKVYQSLRIDLPPI